MNLVAGVFAHVLHHMGLSGAQPGFVVIGAMDGVSFDEFHVYVRRYGWSGLLVEPMLEQFKRLVANYETLGCSPHNRYENCAIAEHDGSTVMLSIDQAAIDAGQVHACFGGMSAIYPPRNGLASEGDADTVRRFGKQVEVPCLTLPSLLERHGIEAFDILCIDAEGWDYKILRQLDFARWRPLLVRVESVNLSPEEKASLVALLDAQGYLHSDDGMNLDAVDAGHWARVGSLPVPVQTSARAQLIHPQVTLVSSLLPVAADLGPGATSHATYQRCRELLGALDSGLRLLLYVAPGASELAAQERAPGVSYLLTRSPADFTNQPQYRLLQTAMDPAGSRTPEADPAALQHWLALSAPFLLNDASLYNPFGTGYFLWVDIQDLAEVTESLAQGAGPWTQVLAQLEGDARLWLQMNPAASSTGQAEPAGEFAGAAHPAARPLASGRALGGAKSAINAFNGVYYGVLDQLLNLQRVRALGEVLSEAASAYPHLCCLPPEGKLDARP